MSTREDLEEKKRHRAIFHLHEQDIRHMLQMPDDVAIWNIYWDERRQTFDLVVVSDRFDRVEDMCEPPWVGSKRTWKNSEKRMVVEFGEYLGNDETVVEE